MASKFPLALPRIQEFFNHNLKKSFSEKQLTEVFDSNRRNWNLSEYTNSHGFIKRLTKKEIINRVEFDFPSYVGEKTVYFTKDATVLQIANSIIPKSYLSYDSALFLNGLKKQLPEQIYITFEQSPKQSKASNLSQDAIDNAFEGPQRVPSSVVDYNDYSFLVTNGKFTDRAGVLFSDDISYTNIERTLIDITVKPNYAGGVKAVLNAYKQALPKLSVDKLIDILDKMNFIYPYHQAIGFYLEKAGCDKKEIKKLRTKPMDFDFYLAYEISESEKGYCKAWKLYFPKNEIE